ncbi:MAG: ferrous iron transport protein A [Dethiobacter sp.]|jgi:Fe2+ transport system protein FeoA|nr:ferrous iron transport protein A [Dethiobacter sp.]
MVLSLSCRKKLACCAEGTEGKIVELTTDNRKILGKLMGLGILPGTPFRLLRRRPGFVLQCGYTWVALDLELAVCIDIESSA